jgi:hypothetical protein
VLDQYRKTHLYKPERASNGRPRSDWCECQNLLMYVIFHMTLFYFGLGI